MKKLDIDVFDYDVSFGDALFNLYHVTKKSEPKEYSEKEKIFHSHSSYECHIITSGKTFLTVENRETDKNTSEHLLKYKELFIIPPKVGHFPFEESKECGELVIAFSLKKTEGEKGFLRYFTDALEAASLRPIPISTKLYEAIVEFCAPAGKYKMKDFMARKALSYTLLSSLFELINYDSATSPEKTKKNLESERFTIEYLINDYSTSLGVIAKTLGYTTRHTTRLIKKLYGKNLTEIRTENMLISAKDMMKKSPELSLSAVARKAGFVDSSAMRTAFQKHVGLTPKEYKNALSTRSEEK